MGNELWIPDDQDLSDSEESQRYEGIFAYFGGDRGGGGGKTDWGGDWAGTPQVKLGYNRAYTSGGVAQRLQHTLGKRACESTRGFESRLLRQGRECKI